jgi:hypothetical protein
VQAARPETALGLFAAMVRLRRSTASSIRQRATDLVDATLSLEMNENFAH